MIRKFLFAILFLGAIAPAFADTGCPIGYGYSAPMVFVGDNLNGATTTVGGITSSGGRVIAGNYRTNNFTEIPVEIGKSYTVATNESKSSILLATYDANHNFIERVNVSDNNYVCDSGVFYVVPVLYVNDENKWQYPVADTEILFLATPLRKVGDYADELDLNKGEIIRNVGVKVFDGTESWSNGSQDFYTGVNGKVYGAVPLFCSHTNRLHMYMTVNVGLYKEDFPAEATTDVASWKSWLAQQYAAGTPVIIYYPLATPVVESFNFSSYTRYELPVIDGDCSLCPPNTYKDFVGNEQCTQCPDRLISPSGAISVNECGRVLRVGGYFTFMPVGRRTEHGLCVMMDGKKYCADVYERQ